MIPNIPNRIALIAGGLAFVALIAAASFTAHGAGKAVGVRETERTWRVKYDKLKDEMQRLMQEALTQALTNKATADAQRDQALAYAERAANEASAAQAKQNAAQKRLDALATKLAGVRQNAPSYVPDPRYRSFGDDWATAHNCGLRLGPQTADAAANPAPDCNSSDTAPSATP